MRFLRALGARLGTSLRNLGDSLLTHQGTHARVSVPRRCPSYSTDQVAGRRLEFALLGRIRGCLVAGAERSCRENRSRCPERGRTEKRNPYSCFHGNTGSSSLFNRLLDSGTVFGIGRFASDHRPPTNSAEEPEFGRACRRRSLTFEKVENARSRKIHPWGSCCRIGTYNTSLCLLGARPASNYYRNRCEGVRSLTAAASCRFHKMVMKGGRC